MDNLDIKPTIELLLSNPKQAICRMIISDTLHKDCNFPEINQEISTIYELIMSLFPMDKLSLLDLICEPTKSIE